MPRYCNRVENLKIIARNIAKLYGKIITVFVIRNLVSKKKKKRLVRFRIFQVLETGTTIESKRWERFDDDQYITRPEM